MAATEIDVRAAGASRDHATHVPVLDGPVMTVREDGKQRLDCPEDDRYVRETPTDGTAWE